MKIFDREPTDWRDLQNLVGQMFEELGCHSQVGATVQLVRGKKEIDVLAVDVNSVPSSIYAIECKYWRHPVPQDVVHSFRTILADMGAHRGFIVSKAGFQSGAREAATNTNLDLYTFSELQNLFFERWKKSITKKYMPHSDALFPYWDITGGKRVPSHWGKLEQEKLHLLCEAYSPFITLGPSLIFSDYHIPLPITVPVLDESLAKQYEITISTYREFFDFLEHSKDKALSQFKALFAERQ